MVLTCKHDFEEQLLLRRFLVNVGVVALTSLIPESRQCQRSSELLKNIYYSLPCGSSEREVESFVQNTSIKTIASNLLKVVNNSDKYVIACNAVFSCVCDVS